MPSGNNLWRQSTKYCYSLAANYAPGSICMFVLIWPFMALLYLCIFSCHWFWQGRNGSSLCLHGPKKTHGMKIKDLFPLFGLLAKIKMLVCCRHINLWSWMRALFRYLFHCWFVQVVYCHCTGRWLVLDNTNGEDSGAFRFVLLYSHYHYQGLIFPLCKTR